MPETFLSNHATSHKIFGAPLETHEHYYEPKFHEDRTIGSGVKSKKRVFGPGPLSGGLDGLAGLAGWDMA